MPNTPDRFPGTRVEEVLQLEDQAADPINVGEIQQNAGALKARDSIGVFDLRSGSGLSEAAHESLDTLAHRVAEDSYVEKTVDGNGRLSKLTVWTDSGKTVRIRETEILTRNAAGRVLTFTEKQYDGAGSVITGQTLSHTIARDAAGRFASDTVVES